MFLNENGGGIASGSVKQRINTHSSTMAELVSCDDFLSKIIWSKNFLHDQGVDVEAKLFQDNESCILLAKKGRSALGKRTRVMNIRYFAMKDHIDSGEMRIAHLTTNEMVADYFTKILMCLMLVVALISGMAYTLRINLSK